jgi:hypothetical protein
MFIKTLQTDVENADSKERSLAIRIGVGRR